MYFLSTKFNPESGFQLTLESNIPISGRARRLLIAICLGDGFYVHTQDREVLPSYVGRFPPDKISDLKPIHIFVVPDYSPYHSFLRTSYMFCSIKLSPLGSRNTVTPGTGLGGVGRHRIGVKKYWRQNWKFAIRQAVWSPDYAFAWRWREKVWSVDTANNTVRRRPCPIYHVQDSFNKWARSGEIWISGKRPHPEEPWRKEFDSWIGRTCSLLDPGDCWCSTRWFSAENKEAPN